MELLFYPFIFACGAVIGSFLNVCIFRIPRGEDVIVTRSHCMKCGYLLSWYDLFPVFSWLFLRGRCRKCGCRISIQYPLVEAANGVLYVIIFFVLGACMESILYSLMASALLGLSVIDARSLEIPPVFNYFIGALGVIRLCTDWEQAAVYLAGFFSVSLFLLFLYWLTKGAGIGGGDIKLMAAAGLLLGVWKILLAFFAGCLFASVLHLLRMYFWGAGRRLAMGPYLSAGILLSALFGNQLLDWYLRLLGL